MSESVKMPALGESVTEGTVTRWLKQVGERVEVDEPLLEVSTDKVDTEVPSPVSGVVERILVQEDETVDVGTELVVIGDGSGAEQAPAAPASAQQAAAADTEPEPSVPAAEAEAAEKPSTEVEEPARKPEAPTASTGQGEAVKMPALGESVTEGTVTRWLKAEGDSVELDEPLLEVSTDKVDTEVPSPLAGVVQRILVQEDETVEVGTDLVIIGAAGAPAPAAPAPAEPAASAAPAPAEPVAPAAQEPAPAAPAPAPAAPAPAPAAAVSASYVTPIVRKLAKDKGVSLDGLAGTGVGGRIRKEDILDAAARAEAERAAAAEAAERAAAAEAAASAAPAPAAPAPAAPAPASPAPAAPARTSEPSPLRGTTEKMTRLRKVIAKRMVESMQVSAQLTTVVEVDVTRVAALRARAKDSFQAREGTKLTFLPFFVKAATEALKAHPKLNASIMEEEIVYHGAEHVGIAVDTERGLLVPVIKDAGDLNLAGIAKRINDLAARTRSNKVTPDDLSGGTFTITNTGSGGALFDTPIINQPEVAILGVGTIVKRPMVVKDAEGNETIGIRSMVYLALSYDHRIVDGADAARYLMAVKARLEEGAFEGEL